MNETVKDYFLKPLIPKQRQYEALRAYYVEGITQKEAAERFGYTLLTFQTIVKNFKSGTLVFFPIMKKGPKERRTPKEIRDKIVYWRKKNLSSIEIQEKLKDFDIPVGVRTIERILKDEGFEKLPRRTSKERGLTEARTQIPEKSRQLDFDKLTDASFDCQVAGVYLFIPFIIKSELDKLINQSSLPETEQLSKLNNVLSILALKLIGQERLCQIINYSFDRGFGLFAGLNVLPKPTAISTYSYLIDKKTVMDFQEGYVSHLNKLNPQYYNGKTVNLDFHTIPHYGENPPLDYNWVGSKNKPMKGALTFFAQDVDSKMIAYTNSDIQRNKSSYEILNFVEYWLNIKGVIDQTLVFDSKLTNYGVLKELDESKIKFITLRRKGSELVNMAHSLPREKWVEVKLKVPKRKYNRFLAYEDEVNFPKYQLTLRQIMIREHGRRDPTFIISNNFDFPLDDIVLYYARRWRIENKISELVNFFNLNALGSPLLIRIYFDVLLTSIADICYRMLAENLPRFENHLAKDIFGRFVDYPGRIQVCGNDIIVKARKRAHTPVLRSSDVFNTTYAVPWWNNKTLRYIWVA